MKVIYLFLLLSITNLNADISIDILNKDQSWSRQDKNGFTVFTKKDLGKVPVLCFHKIGFEPRYEITADNFEKLISYLIKNNFYLLSDKEFINKDFSMVPTGFTPIVLGSDDASEGNFLYKTNNEDIINGSIDYTLGHPQIQKDTMVSILEKYVAPVNGVINFTFYVSFNGIPFRQTGGENATGDYYQGLGVVKNKFNYLLDNFILGIHTVTHPITRNTSPNDFKWEIDEFYKILYSYVGDKINLINTIAYPYGCADINPELRNIIQNYDNNGVNIIGGFDFNGYFSPSPFSQKVDFYDISRLGVDNQNIENVYGFLNNVKLFNTQRVIVTMDKSFLEGFEYNNDDIILIGEL